MRTGILGLLLTLVLTGCRGGGEPAATPTAVPSGPTYTQIEGTPYRAVPLEPPRAGVLIADEEAAQINVRSQPTTQSDSPGSGTAGDEVELHQLAEGEGGYSWYYAKLPQSNIEGWIRGDFIEMAAPEAATAAEDACEEDAQAAFFETNTFAIYICRTASGLRYVGTHKQTQKSLVTEDVKANQGTYIAIDGNIQYHLNDVTLAVYQVNDGEFTQILGEPIIRHQRFE